MIFSLNMEGNISNIFWILFDPNYRSVEYFTNLTKLPNLCTLYIFYCKKSKCKKVDKIKAEKFVSFVKCKTISREGRDISYIVKLSPSTNSRSGLLYMWGDFAYILQKSIVYLDHRCKRQSALFKCFCYSKNFVI